VEAAVEAVAVWVVVAAVAAVAVGCNIRVKSLS
jgi:hypothetical protein